MPCLRECGVQISALRADHAPPDVHRPAGCEHLGRVGVEPGQLHHLAGQGQGQLNYIGGAAAGQDLDCLAHFEGVTDRQSQRGVHVGQQSHRLDPGGLAQCHHPAGEFTGLVQTLHERPAAELDVEH